MKRKKRKKGRASLKARFEYLRHKIADEIETEDIENLAREIRGISGFRKLTRYILVSNILAKKKRKIKTKAYQVKYLALLRLYEIYPKLVRIEIDPDNSRDLIFKYQEGGVSQVSHCPLFGVKQILGIGGFDTQMLPEAIRELI